MTERAERLLDIATIYLEPAVADYERGRAILARFPDAERVEVPSHWNIPQLHGNPELAPGFARVKRDTLVLGVKKGLRIQPYERSSDFVAPSQANGCGLACAYCYVPRRKGFANPVTTFVNIEQIMAAIERHAARQGMKLEPTAADPDRWVYELGTNSDAGVDALISDNVRDLVALFRRLPNAKATFSTKLVNRALLAYDPQGATRIRFSLMPAHVAKVVDVRTSPVDERIAAINDFAAAGYEVNLNFAPVIYTDTWREDYVALFRQLDGALSDAVKRQLVAEVIFLTHNEGAHELNMQWHPQGEALLWRPELQERKVSGGGGENLRYRSGFKGGLVRQFRALLAEHMPYCAVRYAF